MTPTLRARHRQIWILLTLLLPIGFMVAWMSIPAGPPTNQPSFFESDTPIQGQKKAKAELGGLDIEIYALPTGKQEVHIHLKEELTSPSAWVYIAGDERSSDIRNLTLLGQLGHKGKYRFEADSGKYIAGVVLYDGIKQSTIQSIYF